MARTYRNLASGGREQASGGRQPPEEIRAPSARILVRSILLCAGALLVAVVALHGRTWLELWTRSQLQSRYVAMLRDLPEQGATELISDLEAVDLDGIPVLTLALTDERESVALAADQAIHRLLARWQFLGRTESSQRVSLLAGELERQATRIPAERRRLAHDIAERILAWPLDRQTTDSGATIAACEAVLRLPLPEQGEIRVAAAPERPLSEQPDDAEPPPAAPLENILPAPLPSTPEPPVPTTVPQVLEPGEPNLLPGASRERAIEPKRFVPPRAMKIER